MKNKEDLNKKPLNNNLEETNMANGTGYAYGSYAEAARNRKRDERTIFDPYTRRFYNIEVFRRPRW